VIELPAGSGPIDFAYRIHTEVGHHCIGAKINGKIVPLDYELVNGDIVDILTSKQSNGPSRDWLSVARTSNAKNRIRQWFKKEKRDENILHGRELLEKEVRRTGGEPAVFFKPEVMEFLPRRLGFQTESDLYAGIGDGAVTAGQVVGKARDELFKKETPVPTAESKLLVRLPDQPGEVDPGVKVKGEKNLVVRLAHCCNPLPGDQIIGYITRGRGITVHRPDCTNVAHYYQGEPERLIEVGWDADTPTTYKVELEVRALDRPRLTMDILNTVSDTRTVINAINSRAKKNRMALVNLKIEIRDLEHLYSVMRKVGQISDVLDVHRVLP
jgi:GTP pyrophosphokinase